MCEYGFAEGTDFNPLNFEQVLFEGNREVKRTITDHKLMISMAKEICMLQRNEKGKKFRQYFIGIEEMWNSPEMVMKRALRIAAGNIETLMIENTAHKQQIAELKPKASYCDIVLNCKDLLPISIIAKDYGWTAARLNSYLHEKGVQYVPPRWADGAAGFCEAKVLTKAKRYMASVSKICGKWLHEYQNTYL